MKKEIEHLLEDIDRAIGGYEEGAWIPDSEEMIALLVLLKRTHSFLKKYVRENEIGKGFEDSIRRLGI